MIQNKSIVVRIVEATIMKQFLINYTAPTGC